MLWEISRIHRSAGRGVDGGGLEDGLMSDAMTPDRARLVELAEAGRTSLASLSAMLGRNPS